MITPLKADSVLLPSGEGSTLGAEGQLTQLSDSAKAEPRSPETVEEEINRLTWSVLDGTASGEERRRLAELVAMQHRDRRLPR